MDGNDIVLFLKNEGFEAYLPSMHFGECKSKYVVVKAMNRNPIPGLSSSNQQYDMLCYVPQNMRSQLESFVLEVEKALVKLGKVMMIRMMHIRSIDFFDIDIRAHMISTSFRVHYQNEVEV